VIILTKNHAQLTAEVARHIAADSVAQGSYKTCFIGCLARKRNDPQYIQDTYGIPVMLTRILEAIFDQLSAGKAVDFFASLPAAVGKDGKDLTRVPWQFLVEVLKKVQQQPQEIQAVIYPVISGLSLLVEGKEWNKDDARAAGAAANAVACWVADDAAEAAFWAADDTSESIRCADAAYCAADASGVPAKWQKELILRLIAEA
jgi:hypothetical protein